MDGILLCQEDAYRWADTVEVVACRAAENGRWHVELDRALFYPEGGGQPADHGVLAGVDVVDVAKREGRVWLTTAAAVPLGPVAASVDGIRRFDHMQQHTAQHLITAVAQDDFGRATTSFHLGQETSSIDLDGALSAPQLQALEEAVNRQIRADCAVEAEVVDQVAYGKLDVRSRGLPAGYDGPVRLVRIAGLDLNTCGGTHVRRLGELQLVHLLGTEKVRGGSRLSYVAGGRALRLMRASTQRSFMLNKALKCGPTEHVAAVQRLLDDAKAAGRSQRALIGELAELLGQRMAASGEGVLHRPESDLGLLKGIADACARAGGPERLLLTGGEAGGVFLIVAPDPVLQHVSPAILTALHGRGGGRGGRMQGKSTDLSGRFAAWEALREA